MAFDFFPSFVCHEVAHIRSRQNKITAVFPIVFTSSFGMKTPNQTFEGYMYKVNRRKRGLLFVRALKTCS